MQENSVCLDNQRRKHLPSYNNYAHSYIELLPPPNHNQHPEGPYSSPYSYSDLRKKAHQKRKIREYSPNKRDIVLALIDCIGAHGELYITNKGLSEKTGISTATIERIVGELGKEGTIKCHHFMPTPTSYRRQIVFCWESLMISHTIKMMDNPTLKSVFSSSSLMYLKDTKYSLSGACPSDKQLASSEPAVPTLPILSEYILDENKKEDHPDSSEKQDSRILNSLEEEMISAPVNRCPKGHLLEKEEKVNIFGTIVTKEELARIEAEKDKERYAAIEKRQAKQEEESHVFTKHQARKERLQNLEALYPNHKGVCEKEGCGLNELKRRMWLNWLYEPFDTDTSGFNPFCHPAYGFMSEEEKDREFIKVIGEWIYPAPYRHSNRNLQLFHKARLRADQLQVTYQDWIMAIYSGVGERNMRYSHINSRFAEAYYTRWVKQGKPIPRKSGESKENVIQLEKLRKWKQSKPGHKRRDGYEAISQQVDPIIRAFAAEYAAQCSSKKTRV